MRRKPVASCILTILALTVLWAGHGAWADWPQMGGPTRNNVSTETGLIRAWPDDGPPVLWRVPLGGGFASPSVHDGRVYLLDRVGKDGDVLRVLDLETGEEIWRHAYDAPGSVSYDGSRTAPTIADGRLYVVGLLGHFHCIDLESREVVWRRHLREDYGADTPRWGVAQAPSLYEDLVIAAPQADGVTVAAWRKATGEPVWQTPLPGLLGYSTPVVTTLCGVDQVVMITASAKRGSERGVTAGIDPKTGAVLWTYDGWQCIIPIPYATALPDDRLFITGGYKAGSAMIRIERDGDGFAARELFTTDKCGSQIQQPILYNNHLYINSNSNEREDGLMCMTLDGDILWQTRDTRIAWFSTTFERGPLLLADGLLFNLDGKRGNLHLIEPRPEEYRELAQAAVLKGRNLWSPMALSRGRLLLRSDSELVCFDVGQR